MAGDRASPSKREGAVMTVKEQHWPLSGDVSQWINPTWWMGSFAQQLGFININETSSADPQLEGRIVAEVASYGRQLGWISEAVETLIGCVRHAGLTDKLTAPRSSPSSDSTVSSTTSDGSRPPPRPGRPHHRSRSKPGSPPSKR